MSPQDAAERKRQERARKRKSGLEKMELWVTRRERKAVRMLLKELRAPDNQDCRETRSHK